MTVDLFFLDVGNADSIVMCAGQNDLVLVDIGVRRALEQFLTTSFREPRIHRIYITHEHGDHAPPVEQMANLVDTFLQVVPKLEVLAPSGVLERAVKRMRSMSDSLKKQRLQDALERLDRHLTSDKLCWRATVRNDSFKLHELSLAVLHPHELYRVLRDPSSNEGSVVLRVEVGPVGAVGATHAASVAHAVGSTGPQGNTSAFRALLLADLEGSGVEQLLLCPAHELMSTLVKIPHHGAWPKNDGPLVQLLDRTQAKWAVLSVGSTNVHGHVKPALFDALTRLQNRTGLRFLCTQVTRTCKLAATSPVRRKEGLARPEKCAGTIRVRIDDNGNVTITPETDHQTIVAGLLRPACALRGHHQPP